MSNSPRVRKMPPRPKITLPVPGQYAHYPQTPIGYGVGTPYAQTPMPMTPGSAQPNVMYANKASEFMFTQFKGIRDFTKSGLSVGEKSAFWLYEKVSSWSRRWFTHIFLFVIVLLYSVAGAALFMYFEGSNEETVLRDIRKDRNETVRVIREFCSDKDLFNRADDWRGNVRNQLIHYESQLRVHFKHGVVDQGDNADHIWTFWNAVFYCGTIYTTIDSFYRFRNHEAEHRFYQKYSTTGAPRKHVAMAMEVNREIRKLEACMDNGPSYSLHVWLLKVNEAKGAA